MSTSLPIHDSEMTDVAIEEFPAPKLPSLEDEGREEEEPHSDRASTMKGNGRRELTNKNGYIYPKSKGRW